MSKKIRISLIIISVLGLLDVIFLPVFSAFGGLFPTNVDMPFLEVIDAAFNMEGAFDLWVVRFTFAILISFVIVLIAALLADKITFIITNALGIVLISIQMFQFSSRVKEVQEALNINKTSYSVGTWVALFLLSVSLSIVLLKFKEKPKVQENVLPNETEEIESNDSILE